MLVEVQDTILEKSGEDGAQQMVSMPVVLGKSVNR